MRIAAPQRLEVFMGAASNCARGLRGAGPQKERGFEGRTSTCGTHAKAQTPRVSASGPWQVMLALPRGGARERREEERVGTMKGNFLRLIG